MYKKLNPEQKIVSQKKAKELINKIRKELNGKHLFDERDWFRINRLMIYYLSDEEAVMFTLLSEVENKWKSKRNSFFNHLNNHFLFTVEYAQAFVNKNADQQRRILRKLEERGLISIKYWVGKKRLIRIDWDNFTEIYIGWIKNYNDLDPFEEMCEILVKENKQSSNYILNEDSEPYF